MGSIRLGCVTLALAVIACGPPPPKKQKTPVVDAVASTSAEEAGPFTPKKLTLERGAMGTRVVISTFTTPDIDEAAGTLALGEAFTEIKRIEELMSTWIATSEVSQINEGAGGPAIKIGPETFDVLTRSVHVAQASEGVFDVTFEAMKGLWKFDEGAEPNIPPKEKIEEARKRIDYRTIELDSAARTARLRDKGRLINLGGIAKGFAVDRASTALEKRGIKSYFVQAGGDLFVRGRKFDGAPFRVGIRDPRGKSETDFFAAMEVEDRAFSTAGDYERAFIKDGRRYHHIIDPRTGYPSTASRSVTVWAEDAFTADALDDAVFILGPEKGLALIEGTPGAGAVIVDEANKVWISSRLQGRVFVNHPPTDGP